MTVGSLFAGIGGFDLGLERAGMTVRWQVEVDAYARGVLERHWPAVHRRGDIRLVEAADLEPVDLVCGGFPCQDISSAGKGAGLDGKRSGLWQEMRRLVRGLRPRWVLAENVSRLRTLGGDRVLADLEAADYACWPLVVGAWAVGAPHRRDRVWIVARLGESAGGGCPQGDRPEGPARGNAESRRSDTGMADGDGGDLRDESGRRSGTNGASASVARATHRWPARPGDVQHEWEAPRVLERRMGRAAYGLSRRLVLKALGNSVVPQVVEAIGRAIVVADQNAP